MILKQHDTRPALIIDLADGSDEIDPGAAESVRIIARRDVGVGFVDENPVISGSTVTHEWLPEETALPGRIWIEVELVWPDGPQTFPAYGQLAVDVVEDLG